jgi:hypothetical protein
MMDIHWDTWYYAVCHTLRHLAIHFFNVIWLSNSETTLRSYSLPRRALIGGVRFV